jgi:hypothetical protein
MELPRLVKWAAQMVGDFSRFSQEIASPPKMRDTSPSGTVLRSDRFAGKELSEALEMFVEGGARREGDRKCFVDKVDEQYEGKNICHFTVAAIS